LLLNVVLVTPQVSEPDEDVIMQGKALFAALGCSTCHGENAQGTDLAPSLTRRSAVQIQRQVHAPLRNMPEFSPDELDPRDLEALIAFLANLDVNRVDESGAVVHLEEVFLYQWMAMVALENGNLEDAKHYLQRAISQLDATELGSVQPVLADLIAQYDAYVSESGTSQEAPPELTLTEFHLRLALNALQISDIEQARHQMGHYTILESDRIQKEVGEEILRLLANGELETAENVLTDLIVALFPRPAAPPANGLELD
jgi:hypothetical protein